MPGEDQEQQNDIKEYVIKQGWTGKLFFTGRGGAGRGKAKNLLGGAGNPLFPTKRGGAGKGSKSAGGGGAGAGNMLRVSAD